MINTLTIHATGKKNLKKELSKEIRSLFFSKNNLKKKSLLKKLKDSDYCNF